MICWGRSPRDWRCHAIDESHDHPADQWRAQCGQMLPVVTPLDDEPHGMCCSPCAAQQLAAVPPQRMVVQPPSVTAGRSYLQRLSAAVERAARSRRTIQALLALADQAPDLSDAQLRQRLAALTRLASGKGQPR